MKRKNLLIWAKTGGRCWYCGCELVDGMTDLGRLRINQWFVADHIFPKTLGGTRDIDNLRPACWSCNSQKRHSTVEEYRTSLSLKRAGIPYFTPDQWRWLQAQGFEVKFDRIVFWGEEQGID